MAAGGTKNRLKRGLPGFGVLALAGGTGALSSALKLFEVILFAIAPPPEGGTPNLHPLLNLGLQFAKAGERLCTSVYRVRSPAFRGSHVKRGTAGCLATLSGTSSWPKLEIRSPKSERNPKAEARRGPVQRLHPQLRLVALTRARLWGPPRPP